MFMMFITILLTVEGSTVNFQPFGSSSGTAAEFDVVAHCCLSVDFLSTP